MNVTIRSADMTVRINTLFEIDSLLTGCGECETRKEMNRKYPGHFAKIDGYCNKECPVGGKLQELGKQLKV